MTDLTYKIGFEAKGNLDSTLSSIDKNIKGIAENASKINKEVEAVDKQFKNVEQTTKKTEKENKSLFELYRRINGVVADTVSTVKNLYDFLTRFDFTKIVRVLTLIGTLLKMKGSDRLASMLFKAAKAVGAFHNVVEKAEEKIQEFTHQYSSLTDAFLKITGLDHVIDFLKTFILTMGTLGASFAAFLSSPAAVKFASTYLQNLEKWIGVVDAKTSKWALTIIQNGHHWEWFADKLLKGITAIRRVTRTLGMALLDSEAKMRTFADAAKETTGKVGNLSSYFNKAIKHTELFEKGIFGLATWGTALSGVFGFLGVQLLRTDSIIGKMTGTALVALSVALGGVVVIIRQLIISIGKLIYSTGTALVNSMQKAVDQTLKLEKSTFAFNFVIKNLTKSTKGAIGSLREWNDVISRFTKKTGFGVAETQNAVSEMIRLGMQANLTKEQMKALLPVIGDLAVANHKDLFQSTLGVMEALGGMTMMLKNMGVDLTDHAIKHSNIAHALDTEYSKLTAAQKAQLRYNILIKKAATLQNLAAESLNTTSGAIRQQEAEWKNITAELGKGAIIIEQRYNFALALLIRHLGILADPLLAAIGFITALTGRVLQVIGIMTQWIFTIVLTVSSIRALNILLQSKVLLTWIGRLAEAKIITASLASWNYKLAASIRGTLLAVAANGLKWKTLGTLAVSALKSTWTALAAVLGPMIKWTTIIGAIVSVFVVIYQSLKKINAVTGIFSRTWDRVASAWQSFWGNTSMIDQIKALADTFDKYLNKAIYGTARGLVRIRIGWLQLKLAFIDVKEKAIELADKGISKVKTGFLKLVDGGKEIANMLWNAATGSNAFARETEIVVNSSDRAAESTKRRGMAHIAATAAIKGEIAAAYEIIKALTTMEETENKKGSGGEGKKKGFSLYDTLVEGFGDALAYLEKAWNDFNWKTAMTGMSDGIKGSWGGIKKAWNEINWEEAPKEVWSATKKGAKNYIDGIGNAGKLLVEHFKNLKMEDVGKGISKGADGARGIILGAVGEMAEKIPMFGGLIKSLLDMFAMGPEHTRKMVTAFMQAIPQIIEGLVESIPVFIETFINNLPSVASKLVYLLVKYLTTPSFSVKVGVAFATAMITAISQMPQMIGDAFYNGIIDGFKEAFNELRGLFKKIFKFDGGGKGAVEKFLGFDFPFIKFASGGLVPGVRSPVDSKSKDSVPALLSPGELVVPNSVLSKGMVEVLKYLDKIGIKTQYGIGGLVEGIVGGASSAFDRQKDRLYQALGQMSDAFGMDFLDKIPGIKDLKAIYESLMMIGAKVSFSDLVANPHRIVPLAVKGAKDYFKGHFRRLMHPLASGGLIPPGYSNDTFPALLSSGERVLSVEQNEQMAQDQADIKILLAQILEALQGGTTAQASVEFDNEIFANIMLDLSRKNARLAV